MDGIDGGFGGDFGGVADIGGPRDVGPIGEIGGAGRELAAAADEVGPKEVEAQAQLVAGEDGFDRAPKAAPAAPAAADEAGVRVINEDEDIAPAPPALKDGDWLHDPRQLTKEQAGEIQRLLDGGGLHPKAERALREFLQDYRNGEDRLFPEAPDPMPRPYPWTDPYPNIG